MLIAKRAADALSTDFLGTSDGTTGMVMIDVHTPIAGDAPTDITGGRFLIVTIPAPMAILGAPILDVPFFPVGGYAILALRRHAIRVLTVFMEV